MPRKPRVYTIDRPQQLAVLASPVRHVIVDALAAAGRACSVSQIAELVDRPADSLYYHLRALSEVGLVRRVPSPDDAERDATYYMAPARGVRIRHDFGSPTFRRNVVRMASAMLRVTERDFSRGAEDPAARGAGKHRNTWAGRVELNLTQKQLEDLNDLIGKILDLQYAGPSSERSRRYAVTIALAPIPERRRG